MVLGSCELLSCSFCGMRQKQVKMLITGSDARICDRCINRVHAVLAVAGTTASTAIAVIRQVSDEGGDGCCGFCGKGRRRVQAMAAAGDARICNECLSLCEEIVSEESGTGL